MCERQNDLWNPADFRQTENEENMKILNWLLSVGLPHGLVTNDFINQCVRQAGWHNGIYRRKLLNNSGLEGKSWYFLAVFKIVANGMGLIFFVNF
jgi:hypothetical protein